MSIRESDLLELYHEHLSDHKIAQILGTYPEAVRRFRVQKQLPPNWVPPKARATYQITNLRNGNTFTGTCAECAEWMDTTQEALRSTCCYQKQFGCKSKRTLYRVERIEV